METRAGNGGVVFYVVVSIAAVTVGTVSVVALVRMLPARVVVPRGGRRAWVVGLAMIAAGAVFFVVGAMDVEGADLGEGLEIASVVRGLGGGLAATGYAVAFMLTTALLLGLVDPERSARTLVRTALAAVPLLAALTTLTALFDREEWKESTIGPFMGSLFFFTVPASLAAALLARSVRESPEPQSPGVGRLREHGDPPRVSSTSRGAATAARAPRRHRAASGSASAPSARRT
jgi:hypothetical protein